MKGRVGGKHYDTDNAKLVELKRDGTRVYRKDSRSTSFFLYDPKGKTAKTRFRDLSGEEAIKYLPQDAPRKMVENGCTIRFTPYDKERIRKHAILKGMSMNKFLVMLVDEYERRTDV